MKILSLQVKSFGKLRDVNLEFHNGVNVLANVNGFGKTTMANFIRAMLYGFTYSRVKGITDAARFAPWGSNDKFGGNMTVEHDGVTYRIERFFGKLAKNEELTVTNAKTNAVVNLPCSPGEFFLGLTADSYDRSAYFPQEAVELSVNDNFEAKLGNLVENSDVDYDKVQKNLRDYRRTLRLEKGNGGKIYELTTERNIRERELNNAIQAERRGAAIDSRLKEIAVEQSCLTAEQVECQKRLSELNKQFAKISMSDADKENLTKLNALEAQIARVPPEIDQDKLALDELANKASRLKGDVKPRIYPNFTVLIISLVLAVVGIVLCFAVLPQKWGKIVGLILVALGIVGVAVSFVRKGAMTLPAGEKDALITEYFQIAAKYICVNDLDYNAVIKEFWRFYSDYLADKRELETLRSIVKRLDDRMPDNLEKNIAEYERKQENIVARLTLLASEAGRLSQEKQTLNTDSITPREQIDSLSAKINKLERSYRVADTVSNLLIEAKEKLSSSYLPKLCARCQQLLNQVTNCNYEVAIDRAFTVHIRENGQTKSMSEFSRGTREITLLCFRIALSELLYDGTIPFIIIDDAFVNFDEDNFIRATNLLKVIAERGQVIYFTCHRRTGNLLK